MNAMDRTRASQRSMMHRGSALEAILRRDRAIVVSGIAFVITLAWAYMLHSANGMRDMEAAMPLIHAWGPADVAAAFVMWAVMMVAMMAPSAAPVIVLFAVANRRRLDVHQPFAATTSFVLGYFVIWFAFAAVVVGVQWALHDLGLLSSPMGRVTPVLGGTVLIAAGAVQWTPLKDVCLQHCRTPLGFLVTEWREGGTGALVMGSKHGLSCLACCWALMTLMFVGGAMNLLWMAGIAVYILVEKTAPAGHLGSRVTGSALIGWGLWSLARATGIVA